MPKKQNAQYVDLMLKIGKTFAGRHTDSLQYYAINALKVAESLKNDSLIAESKQEVGISYFYSADYVKARELFKQALAKYEQLNDHIKLGIILSNIGVCNIYMAEYETAINYLMKAHAILQPINHPKLASAVNNLGLAYNKIGDNKAALTYYIKAAKLKEKYGLKNSLSNTLNNIGIIYKNNGEYDSALYYYQRSLDLAIEFKDLKKQANALNNLAILYEMNNDLQKAEVAYTQAIEIKKEFGDNSALMNSYNNLASTLIKQNKLKEAKDKLNLADSLEALTGDDFYASYGFIVRSEYNVAIGDYKVAYELMNEAMLRRINEINEDRNQRISEWEVKLKTAQKEAEITKLSLENELQAANLARNRNTILGLAISGAITIIFLVVYFILRNKKIRAEKEAQELQIEALKKRFMELHSSPAELAVSIAFDELNEKLNTKLTEREFDALKLSLEGKTNAEIAEALFISVSTVKFHLRNVYIKIGVGNRKEAFSFMLRTV